MAEKIKASLQFEATAETQRLFERFDKFRKDIGDLRGQLDRLMRLNGSGLEGAARSSEEIAKNQERAARAVREQTAQIEKQKRGGSIDAGRTLGIGERILGGLGGNNAALGLAGDIADVIDLLPQLSGGIGGLVAVIGPAAIAAGAASLAIGGITSAIDELTRRAAENAELVSTLSTSAFDANQLLLSGQISQLDELQSTLQTQLARTQAEIDALRDSGLTEGVFSGGPARERIAELEKDLVNIGAQLFSVTTALNDPLAEGLRFAEQLAAETENAADAVADAAQAEEKRNAELERATDSLARLTEREADLRAQYAEAIKDRNIDRTIALRRQEEDQARSLARELVTLNRSLAEIASDGARRIEELTASIGQRQIDAQAQITDVLRDAAAQRAELETRAAEDALRRLEQYRDARQRIEDQYEQDAFDAIADNNIVALVKLRRDRDTEQRRLLADKQREDRYRQEDLARQIAAINTATSERIDAINRETAEFIAGVNEKIAAERAAIQERIIAERKAFEERQRLLEDERTLARRRAEEDQRLADQRAQRAFQQRLAAIAAEQRALQTVLGVSTQIETVFTRMKALLGSGAPQTAGLPPLPPPKFAGGTIQPFANGGIIRKPTLALMGERGPEMVVPLTGPNAGRGMGVTINAGGLFSGANISLGENVSRSEMERFGDMIEDRVISAVAQAVVSERTGRNIA